MKDIGILLRQTRESKGLEISDAATQLKIRRQYIEVLESGDTSSISSEIYLTGYLKSYANWLGLNGNSLTSKLNKRAKAEPVQKVSSSAPTQQPKIVNKSSSFNAKAQSGKKYRITLPNKKIVLLSLIIPAAIFFLLHESHSPKTVYSPEIATSGKVGAAQPGLPYLKEDPRKLILMANEPLTLKMTQMDGTFTTKSMAADEIFFPPKDTDILITADIPQALDVFIDDQSNSFLGNLEEISK
jgi:transcriptional regulator with XRE-family HTH domain